MKVKISDSKLRINHATSRVLHRIADYRSTATDQEKKCYKPSESILLTFDDYGSRSEIVEILSILKEKSVKAAFFLQGDWVEKNPELVQLIKTHGHVLGNHTYSHKVLTSIKPQEVIGQITRGLPGPWFRPPKGRYNAKIRKIVQDLGFVICYWTIDSRDWTGISVDEMRFIIMSELKPGAVILFHIHGKNTRALLPGLIDGMRQKGFSLTAPEESWNP